MSNNASGSAAGPAGATDGVLPEGVSINANGSISVHKPPLLANEQTLDFLKRNNYTKASGIVEKVVLEEERQRVLAAAQAKQAAGNVGGAAEIAKAGGAADGSAPGKIVTTPAIAPSAGQTQSNQQLPPIRAVIPPTEPGLSAREMLKRNLPQAMTLSASTLAYYLTPQHYAQAEDLIQRHKAATAAIAAEVSATGADAATASANSRLRVLDITDRVRGYVKLRQWVESGLEGWKSELRELLYPVFVHTFIDLIESGYTAAAVDFLQEHMEQHRPRHQSDLVQIQSIRAPIHIISSELLKLYRTQKYNVNLSQSSFGLFVGWLSDLGLEALWDTDRDGTAYKDSVRTIVQSRLRLQVAPKSAPLSLDEIHHLSGFASVSVPTSAPNAEAFNSSGPRLKLAPPNIPQKLAKHLEDEAAAQQKLDALGTSRIESDQSLQQVNGINPQGAAATEHSAASGTESRTVTESDDVSRKAMVAAAAAKKTEGSDDLVQPEPEEFVPPVSTNRNFSTMDLDRELKNVIDQRKRIKVGHLGSAAPGRYQKPPLPSVCTFTLYDDREGMTSTALAADSSYLAAGSSESTIRLWDLKGKGRADDATKLIGHSGPVYALDFDPIGGAAAPPRHLLSGSQDGSVRLWSLDQKKNIAAYRGHSDPVWDVQWGPMGVYFASASRDRTARLWTTERITPMRMYVGHLSDVECLRFHPNSLYLATASADRTCRLWDTQRGECVRVFLGHTDVVTTLAMSPDGRYMASAGLDLSIRLWDLNSGREIKSMTGHTQQITSLTFSAEAAMLVSGSLDNTVRCWDVKAQGGYSSAPPNEGAGGQRTTDS